MGDSNQIPGTSKTPRNRLIIDTEDDTISQAADRLAAKETIRQGRKVSKSEVICNILLERLAAEIRELKELGDKLAKPKKKSKP